MGEVLRNNNVNRVAGFQHCACANSLLHVELLALEQGLELALQLNLQQLEVEVDSTG